ncbi:heat shock factor protein HSF8-like isoform X1 [Apium graveolens]|uniref:heat shock factor protein HSF8-like isoform X1 n=1 Tax=Apium graveolens TaxID=4045 RepID=UPI003D7A4E9C
MYNMVDDPANHSLISWRPMNSGFIVKDEKEFARILLPKYFRHNNFSSFLRQLYYYGFKRVDLYWWEFENEGFVRGKRHLLSSIDRRDPAHVQKQQLQQTHGQSSRVEKYDAIGKLVLEKEVEKLKRDNNVIMQELVKSGKQQQTTATQLEAMGQRLDVMEQKQQEMASILSKDVNISDLSAQFVQEQTESSMLNSAGNKKRKLKPDVVPDDHPVTPDGQLLSPDTDFVWDIFSIDEILKSSDLSGGQFPL